MLSTKIRELRTQSLDGAGTVACGQPSSTTVAGAKDVARNVGIFSSDEGGTRSVTVTSSDATSVSSAHTASLWNVNPASHGTLSFKGSFRALRDT